MNQFSRRLRALAFTALLIGMNNNPAWADLRQLDLPTKVVSSDLIARVKVLSLDGPIGAIGFPVVAKSRVLESARGLKKGARFDLVFREGTAFSSPNVRDRAGDDCIIFATILPNGQYRTFNYSDGKYLIKDKCVLRWGKRGKKSRQYKPVEVMAAIRNLVDKPEDWSKPIHGISVLLRSTHQDYEEGQDIDVVFFFKNTSQEPVSIPYRGYPVDTMTYWSLDMRRGDNHRIDPIPHPHLTPKDIDNYALKHTRKYSMIVAPGEISSRVLNRINSAEQGWGAKENLNYAYYTMDTPGVYMISAEGHNMWQGDLLKTKSIRIRIQKAMK